MQMGQQAQQLTRAEVAALLSSHQSLQDEVDQLKRQLAWFKKQLFGAKSERRLVDVNSQQLSLGEALTVADETDAVEPSQPVAGYTRRRGNKTSTHKERSGLRFDDTVPVELIELPAPEARGLSDGDYEVIGEKVTHRLAQRPGSYVVLKYVRPVIKRKDTGTLSCAAAPAAVLERSYADVSFLAGLLVDKFVYHLPLYRQHRRLADAGVTVSRGWLTQLVQRVAPLLEPIYRAQLNSILAGSVIAMDETPIKAGRKKKGRLRTSYFWPVYGDRDEVVFPWFDSRAAMHVKTVLGNYQGTLLSDGYTAYERYAARHDNVVHAQCWSHARRHYIDAEAAEPQRVAVALDYLGALYAEEKAIVKAKLTGKKKLQHRAERCAPIVERFFDWCEQQMHAKALLPSNPLTQALAYTLSRRAELSVYLSNPDVPIDTNHLERALRPIPMGRRNWLFCWSEIGAQHVGIVQSLLVTCRLHKINPYDYLVDVLQRIDRHPASRVSELTPRLWKTHFAGEPLRSPLASRT